MAKERTCSECEGFILADTEHWNYPLCPNHYEEWKEVIDYVSQVQVGEGMHVHSYRLHKPRYVPHGTPSLLLELELVPVDAKIPRTVIREFSAKKARRYVEKMKEKAN